MVVSRQHDINRYTAESKANLNVANVGMIALPGLIDSESIRGGQTSNLLKGLGRGIDHDVHIMGSTAAAIYAQREGPHEGGS
jgi:hypothetical protein